MVQPKPPKPHRGRPPVAKPQAQHRYSVNFNDDENFLVLQAAMGDAFISRWIRQAAVQNALGTPIYIAKHEGDEAFEAAVKEHFPYYRILGDATLKPMEIRIGTGSSIPASAHGIKRKAGYKRTARLPGAANCNKAGCPNDPEYELPASQVPGGRRFACPEHREGSGWRAITR